MHFYSFVNNWAEVVCIKRGKKAKSQNFNLTEIIKNQVRLNPILKAKHSNTVTNDKKKHIWRNIIDKVIALGVSRRTIPEVKDTWRDMCREAKLKFTEHRRQRQKTGGGPPPTPLSPNIADVDMYRDSSAFSSIQGGMETSISNYSGKKLLKLGIL